MEKNSNTYLIGLLQRLNELTHAKHLLNAKGVSLIKYNSVDFRSIKDWYQTIEGEGWGRREQVPEKFPGGIHASPCKTP